ncbi:MAG: amino acid permease, partial [Verrucomicrobiales bacterium]|nr:amino acid permease [Verrucomicrobiales bacterium]
MAAQPSALRRSMGLPHATAMVVGTILGASIFVQPAEIGRFVPSVSAMMAVWVSAGLLTLCGALVCAELAAAYPHTGGVYIFLKELFSPAIGFLWGWAMFWSVHSGIIAALSVIFARYVGYFVSLDDAGIRLIAIAGIFLLSAVNYVGVRAGSTVQLLLTVAKLLAIAMIILFFFALGMPAPTPLALATPPATQPGLRDFALAITAGLFSYGGWHMVTYAAGETRDARRTIPRALLLGTLLVTACYLALNAAYLHVLPLDDMIRSVRVAADAAERVLGPSGAAFISALVILSTLGALTGIILAGPRVYYAMAKDGLGFRWLGSVHPRFQTPHRAILLQAGWSAVLVATDSYRNLFTRVIYTEWLFFALLAVGVLLLRRRPAFQSTLPAWTH